LENFLNKFYFRFLYNYYKFFFILKIFLSGYLNVVLSLYLRQIIFSCCYLYFPYDTNTKKRSDRTKVRKDISGKHRGTKHLLKYQQFTYKR